MRNMLIITNDFNFADRLSGFMLTLKVFVHSIKPHEDILLNIDKNTIGLILIDTIGIINQISVLDKIRSHNPTKTLVIIAFIEESLTQDQSFLLMSKRFDALWDRRIPETETVEYIKRIFISLEEDQIVGS